MNVIREDIRLGHYVGIEWLVALPPTPNCNYITKADVVEPPQTIVAVYEYYSRIDKHSWRYVLKGVEVR